jgi:glyoxylase-like metal-dependent hydrolase (beta-lactamase superfamily II)
MGRIFKNYFLPETICHCFLIETGSKLVLVDTGIGREDMRDPSRLGMMAPLLGLQKNNGANSAYEQVRTLGYTPEDVTDIIVTHMDVDHAGGIPDFKWANVHVHERELEAASARSTFVTKQRYSALHVLKDSKWEPFSTGPEKWHGFDRAQELGLGPDILAISLPGHTVGHSGIAVRRGNGWLLHAGDAYYNRREISADDRVPLGVEMMKAVVHTDLATTKKTQGRLHELVEDSTIQMVCSHDPVEFRAFAKASPTIG